MKYENLIRIKNILLILMLFIVALFITIEVKEKEIEKLIKENKKLEVAANDLEVTNTYLTTQNNNLVNQNKELHRYKEVYDGLSEINMHTETRYYDIPLTAWQQEFIQIEAEKKGFGETFIYGLQQYESYFGENADSGVSKGIMQIHEKYAWKYAELAGLETYNIFDFKDNIRMGIAYLAYLRESYISEGITSQEELTYLTLLAYNRGKDGADDYIKENGTIISDYAQIVLKYKFDIEQTLQEGVSE